MLTFLFWNLRGKKLDEILVRLIDVYDVGLLILAESTFEPADLCAILNQRSSDPFIYHHGYARSVTIYSRVAGTRIVPVFEEDRLTIRRIFLTGSIDFLLAGAHLVSKLHFTDTDQMLECTNFSRHIRAQERIVRHQRTLLVGDLNMNPFEPGIVSAAGLNGVMTRALADKRERTIQGTSYPFFYNPMWRFFGDANGSPPGTYYYSRAGHVAYFWNIFDQVLIRPDLMPFFDADSLQILTEDGSNSLLTGQGVPDDKRSSDHLPLLFRLNL